MSFLWGCFHAGGEESHSRPAQPSELPTAFPINVPLKYDPNDKLGAYPLFTDESLRLESLSLYPKQATPPCLPTNPVHVCLCAELSLLPRQPPWGGLPYFASLA